MHIPIAATHASCTKRASGTKEDEEKTNGKKSHLDFQSHFKRLFIIVFTLRMRTYHSCCQIGFRVVLRKRGASSKRRNLIIVCMEIIGEGRRPACMEETYSHHYTLWVPGHTHAVSVFERP